MRLLNVTSVIALGIAAVTAFGSPAYGDNASVQLGPRPFYLVDQMTEGDL